MDVAGEGDEVNSFVERFPSVEEGERGEERCGEGGRKVGCDELTVLAGVEGHWGGISVFFAIAADEKRIVCVSQR